MDLQQIKNGLAALKATPIKAATRTKKAIIEELAEDIRELRAAGHSFASILEIIAAGGVELKESTLKKYLIDCAPKKRQKRKVKKDAPVTSSEASSAQAKTKAVQVTPSPPRLFWI